MWEPALISQHPTQHLLAEAAGVCLLISPLLRALVKFKGSNREEHSEFSRLACFAPWAHHRRKHVTYLINEFKGKKQDSCRVSGILLNLPTCRESGFHFFTSMPWGFKGRKYLQICVCHLPFLYLARYVYSGESNSKLPVLTLFILYNPILLQSKAQLTLLSIAF